MPEYIILNEHYVLWTEPAGKNKQQVWASILYQEDEIKTLDDLAPDWGVSSEFHELTSDAIMYCLRKIAEEDIDRAAEVAELLNKRFCWAQYCAYHYPYTR